MRAVLFIAALLVVVPSLTSAHMFMAEPWGRGDPTQALVPEADKDYTPHGPASAICKGHKKGAVAQTITAGEMIKVRLSGAIGTDPSGWALHHGGHCQWAISYDDGKTFATIARKDHTCMVKDDGQYTTAISAYTVKAPSSLYNSDAAIFAWTWIPAQGGPSEFFMTCADVKIVGGKTSGGVFTGGKLQLRNMPGYPTHPKWGGGKDPLISKLYGKNPRSTITCPA